MAWRASAGKADAVLSSVYSVFDLDPISVKGDEELNRLCALALAVCISSIPGKGLCQNSVDVLSGTILVRSLTERELVVAADSRIQYPTGDSRPRDDSCKIIQLSPRAVFFYWGASEIRSKKNGEILLSVNAIARDAYRRFPSQSNELRLESAANFFGESMAARLDAFLATSTSVQMSATLAGSGGFGGLDSRGTPFLYTVEIGIDAPNGQRATATFKIAAVDPSSPYPVAVGGVASSAGVSEFLARKTERAARSYRKYEERVSPSLRKQTDAYLIRAALQAALQWAKDDSAVGGLVDVVVLQKGKSARWIQRKPACQKEDCCERK